MGRCRFVEPKPTRLFLADVYKRAHEELITKGKPSPATPGVFVKATADDIAASASAVREAEADGEWIDVKGELNSGETRKVFTNVVLKMEAGSPATLDPDKVGLTKILEYLLGWSLRNYDGSPAAISEGAINSLDTDTYREIVQAIDWHEEEQDKARTERKNVQGGESTLKPLSPSVAS